MPYKRLSQFLTICALIITSSLFTENAMAKKNKNNPPSVQSKSYFLNENTSLDIVLTGSDSDQDFITYTVVEGPSNGTLTGNAPNLFYAPNTNYDGNDSFTYKVNDSKEDSEIATISFVVTDVGNSNPNQGNIAPECRNSEPSVSVIWPPNHKFTTIDILGISDVEGEISTEIQCIKQDEPLNSTGDGSTEYDGSGVGASSAAVRRERKGNSNGRVYHIGFIATDSNGARCGGIVNVAVPKNKNKTAVDEGPIYDSVVNNGNCETENINNPPLAFDQPLSLDEDVTVEIALVATDPDQDQLTFSIEEAPLYGELTGVAPNLVYVPAENFNGDDSFSFRVNDGEKDSNIATVSIVVEPVNDAPVTQSQSLEANEDTDLPIVLAGSDVDGDTITFSILSGPSNGVLVGDTPNLVYKPNLNFNGEDSFTIRSKDEQLDSETATVTVNILPINDAPIASSQQFDTNEDSQLSVTLMGSDIDNATLQFSLLSQPSHGTLSGTAPNIIYTPNENYYGEDSLTFLVNDGALNSSSATISITIKPVNDFPTVNAGSDQTVIEGTSVSLSAVASDIDGQIVNQQWTEAGQVLGSTLALNMNTLSIGTHVLTVSVTDNDGATATDDVTITVEKKPNVAPIVEAGVNQTITEGDTLTLSATASDTDGQIVSQQWRKGAELAGDTLVLSINNLGVGERTFTITVTDNEGETATDSLVVTVQEKPNEAPIANNQTITTDEGVATAITLSASDTDGDALTYSIVTNPVNGIISGGASNLTYTPNTSFYGEDSFTFNVNDGMTDSSTATVTISIIRSPDTIPPVITLNGVDVSIEKGGAYNELGATATDDRDGTVGVVISGTVDTNTVGIYTINYTATDSAGNTVIKIRNVTVMELADITPPIITLNGGGITVNVGEAYTELGATAVDDRDGIIDVVITGNVDTQTIGTYAITYTAIDLSNNSLSTSILVTVISSVVTVGTCKSEEITYKVDADLGEGASCKNTLNNTEVFGGSGHFFVLNESGKAWGWGDNGFGQLRDGTVLGDEIVSSSRTRTQYAVELDLSFLEGAELVSIKGANRFSIALDNQNRLWEWGDTT